MYCYDVADTVYLCNASVDIHGGHGELAGPGQLIETMHSHDALLHDALERRERRRALLSHSVRRVAAVVQYLQTRTDTHRSTGVLVQCELK